MLFTDDVQRFAQATVNRTGQIRVSIFVFSNTEVMHFGNQCAEWMLSLSVDVGERFAQRLFRHGVRGTSNFTDHGGKKE